MASPKKKPEPQEPVSRPLIDVLTDAPPTRATVPEIEAFLQEQPQDPTHLLVLGMDARLTIRSHYRSALTFPTLAERDRWCGIPIQDAGAFFFTAHTREVSLYRSGQLVRSFLCHETPMRPVL